MNLTFQAGIDAPAYRIDAHQLNLALAAALGGWNNGYDTSGTHQSGVVIRLDAGVDVELVTSIINDHIANTDIREANKQIQEQILALEAKVTQRMLRERRQELTDIDDQIKALRLTRQ
jgi:hypothetical protein